MVENIYSFRKKAEEWFTGEVFLVSDLLDILLLPEDYKNNLFYINRRSEKGNVFILSGVHADEKRAPELVLDYLGGKKTCKGFLCYPILNEGFAEEGSSSGLEYNYFDCSLRTTFESSLFMDFLEKNNDFDYFIDVHECPFEEGIVYESIVDDDNPLKTSDLERSWEIKINDSAYHVSKKYNKSSFTVELPLNGKREYLEKVLDYFF